MQKLSILGTSIYLYLAMVYSAMFKQKLLQGSSNLTKLVLYFFFQQAL